MAEIRLIDQAGNPLPTRSERLRAVRDAARASLLGGAVPYDAASYNQNAGDWYAWLGSPDVENNPYRDRIVSRIRDLARNDGWASGGITRIVDSAIGGDFRLVSKPDWRSLKALSGAAFDAAWADEFGRAVEAAWRSYAYAPGRWCDVRRTLTVPQMFRLAFRHELVEGESLAMVQWLPQRRGYGRADYATALQLIDPDRLSNPQLALDTPTRRGGVELDQYGAPVAYHIREAHQGDWWNAAKSVTWKRIPRETTFGRTVTIHNFTPERADQHRPAGGILTPVLTRLKMLSQYDGVELQAAIVNAVFAAFIESPFDHDAVADALGEQSGNYQDQRIAFHETSPLKINGVRLPTLYPGEKINTVTAARPATGYEPFQAAALRNIASAMGMSVEQLSQDWSRTNYSSARAALLEAWKTQNRRRLDFAIGFATPFYTAWLEEAVERANLPLPAGAPDFPEARAAYAGCRWMGAPRGWVDPLKEAQAAAVRRNNRTTTLEIECAEQGLDWEEVIDQLAREDARLRESGLLVAVVPPPTPRDNSEKVPEKVQPE